MVGIYKITNQINGKVYIGQSVDIARRLKAHKNTSKNKNSESYDSHFYRAIRKYGTNNFLFDVLEQCTIEELNDREIHWIKYYNSTDPDVGYNLSSGGAGSATPQKITQKEALEIIDKLKNSKNSQTKIANDYNISQQVVSLINKGQSWTQKNISYPIREGNFYGENLNLKPNEDDRNFCKDCGAEISQKALRCMSCHLKFRKGNRPPPLELARMIKEKGFSGTGREYNLSGNAIKKWCMSYEIPHRKQELVEWYDKQMGIETPKPKQQIRKVQQIDPKTGEILNIFDNATIAAKKFGGVKGSHVSEVCNGKGQTAYGYKWKYM